MGDSHEAVAVPHAGLVWLDLCDNESCFHLAHSESQEVVQVPGARGEKELAFDNDGFAYIHEEGKVEEIDVDGLLQWRLFEQESGGKRLLVRLDGNRLERLYLDTWSRAFVLKDVMVKIGPTRSAHAFNVAVCDRPRHGFKVFYSMTSVYNALGLTQFSGCGSRWSWQTVPTCEKFVHSVVPGQIARSMSYTSPKAGGGQKTCAAADAEDSTRVFPWHCLSSLGILAVLVRWSALHRPRGGFETGAARDACALCLQSLLKPGDERKALTMTLCLDNEWKWRWPRQAHGENPVELAVQDPLPTATPQTSTFLNLACSDKLVLNVCKKHNSEEFSDWQQETGSELGFERGACRDCVAY